MKTIFRGMRDLRIQLECSGSDSVQPQLEMLKRVEDFVYEGSYTTYKKKAIVLQNPFLNDTGLAFKLDMEEPSARKTRIRISDSAYSVLGKDILSLIETGTEKSLALANLRLQIANQSFEPTKLFPMELLIAIRKASSLEEREFIEFSIEDYLPELALLRWMSVSSLIDIISMVDVARVEELLKILSGELGTFDDKFTIARFLKSDSASLKKHFGKDAVAFPPVRKEFVETSPTEFESTEISEEELFDNVD